MKDHYVLLEGNGGAINATFVCEAQPGADCRMVPDCECDPGHCEGCLEKHPDGPPLVDLGECNHGLYINAEGAEWCASAGEVKVAVTTEWDGDGYLWDFDKATS